MDRNELDRRIDQHGRNIVAGHFEGALEDFAEDLKPGVPEVARLLPQALHKAELLDLFVHGDTAAVSIRYSNSANEFLVIESIWREQGGRLLIVAAAPVLPGQPGLHALVRTDQVPPGVER
jgi:hypothetical protein